MGHYMRFITTSDQPITLDRIARSLGQIDPAYTLVNIQFDDTVDLMHNDVLLGQIEINRPGDDIFEDDISELKDLVAGEGRTRALIMETLNRATAILAIEAFWQGQDSDAALQAIDPLWDWLFTQYPGLLQVDNDGIYDESDLILELSLKL